MMIIGGLSGGSGGVMRVVSALAADKRKDVFKTEFKKQSEEFFVWFFLGWNQEVIFFFKKKQKQSAAMLLLLLLLWDEMLQREEI